MPNSDCDDVVQRAEQLYHERLKPELERSHLNEFVAIEPISGDYFLGRTLSEAVSQARKSHPDRISYAIRVGHKAAIHMGAAFQ
jgi:hypothetical protein